MDIDGNRSVGWFVSSKTGLNEIVRQLNAAKILPPIEYAKSKGLQGNYQESNGFWNTRSLKKILTNRTYTGNLLQGKKQILVENTHEAIVSKEIFELVQAIITTTAEAKPSALQATTTENLLKGKVICGSCAGKMQRRKGSGNADCISLPALPIIALVPETAQECTSVRQKY